MRRKLPAVLTMLLIAGFLVVGAPAGVGSTATAVQPSVPASTFTPVTPLRVLDTRTGAGGVSGTVGAGGTITLDLTARLPSTATAVVLNVTGVSPTATTYVTVFPTGVTLPNVSSLNLAAGDTRANQVTVTLGTNRSVRLYNNYGSVHLVADLAGYYVSGATGGKFTALLAERVFDTRQQGGALGPGSNRVVDLSTRIPASATAVTFNLTATAPTEATFVTAWPAGSPRPNVSNLNLVAKDTRPNQVTVPVGVDRKISLYNNAGSVELIVDFAGFYNPDYGAVFFPRNPKRVLDTRNGTGTGGSTSPVGPGEILDLDLTAEVPLTVTGVALNLTGVNATAATFVSAWVPFATAFPPTSTLNVSPGQTVANAAMVANRSDRVVGFYNHSGNIHLIADLAGTFAVTDPTPCTSDCVYTWGRNHSGQLGTGQAVTGSPVPTRVVALSGVRAVTGGASKGYALRGDGTVWAWGSNESGQLGNGWGAPWDGGSAVPVPVLGLTGVTAVAGGRSNGYALRSDGTVWSWGANYFGQLGNGSLDISSVPVRVSGLTGVVAVAAGKLGATGYALRSDGTVWSWGDNAGGELGNGSDIHYAAVPVQVTGLTGVTGIAAGGGGGYALRSDGTVWSWGGNHLGELGNGLPCPTTAPCVSRVPVRVSGLIGVTAIARGWSNGYAVRNDGTAWAWGGNYGGQLGDGTPCNPATPCESRVPVRVSGLTGVTQIAAYDDGGYAMRNNGTVWSWGYNGSGELGNLPAPEYSTVPVQVMGLPAISAIDSGTGVGYTIVPRP